MRRQWRLGQRLDVAAEARSGSTEQQRRGLARHAARWCGPEVDSGDVRLGEALPQRGTASAHDMRRPQLGGHACGCATLGSKKRRLESKTKRGSIKAGRGKVDF